MIEILILSDILKNIMRIWQTRHGLVFFARFAVHATR